MILANRDHCSRDGGKRERLGCEGVCIKTKKRDQTSGIESDAKASEEMSV